MCFWSILVFLRAWFGKYHYILFGGLCWSLDGSRTTTSGQTCSKSRPRVLVPGLLFSRPTGWSADHDAQRHHPSVTPPTLTRQDWVNGGVFAVIFAHGLVGDPVHVAVRVRNERDGKQLVDKSHAPMGKRARHSPKVLPKTRRGNIPPMHAGKYSSIV